jgi:hypothetical protein
LGSRLNRLNRRKTINRTASKLVKRTVPPEMDETVVILPRIETTRENGAECMKVETETTPSRVEGEGIVIAQMIAVSFLVDGHKLHMEQRTPLL